MKTCNSFEEQPIQTEQQDDLQASGESFTYTFPAHSVTMLKGRIAR